MAEMDSSWQDAELLLLLPPSGKPMLKPAVGLLLPPHDLALQFEHSAIPY